jgi:hypothetical protein
MSFFDKGRSTYQFVSVDLRIVPEIQQDLQLFPLRIEPFQRSHLSPSLFFGVAYEIGFVTNRSPTNGEKGG